MKKTFVVVTLMTVIFALSCNKDDLVDNIYWETSDHFTGDKKGSFTLSVDSITYDKLTTDILLAAGNLDFVIEAHDSLDIIFLLTNLPAINEEAYVGDGDSCKFQLVPKEDGMELTPQEVIELSFVATSGTIKRTAKDKVEISAEMKDDQGIINRHLEAEIYIGIITLDVNQ